MRKPSKRFKKNYRTSGKITPIEVAKPIGYCHFYINMNRVLIKLSCLAMSLILWTGCQTPENPPSEPVAEKVEEAPPTPVVSDEIIGIEGYIAKISESNLQARQEKIREMNQDTVKAYNLDSGNYEYVETDSLQRWNEEKKRWEFRPE